MDVTAGVAQMKSRGDHFEERAASLVAEAGLQLVARNFRTKTGEIDLIARDCGQLVFIEVRSRSNRFYASAAGSVDARKQRRIILTAHLFLQRRPQWANMPCRFDVIAFEPPQSGTCPLVKWIRGAFTA